MIGVYNVINVMAESLFPVVDAYYKTFSKYGQDASISWDNERFYQRLCMKGLAESLNCNVLADRDLNGKNVDLQVLKDDICQVAIEMKRFFSASGEPEIPRFLDDIRSLQNHLEIAEKIFVITTIHDIKNQDDNINFLSEKLNIPKDSFVRKSVALNENVIFEIIGIVI